jgi:hypothetical protein
MRQRVARVEASSAVEAKSGQTLVIGESVLAIRK